MNLDGTFLKRDIGTLFKSESQVVFYETGDRTDTRSQLGEDAIFHVALQFLNGSSWIVKEILNYELLHSL